MPKKSDVIRLRHMLDAAEKASAFARGKKRQDLETDEKLALALVRLLEILGEAASKISSDITSRNADIPWKEIIGTRNRLVHGYEDVDLDIVWKIVDEELTSLARELRTVLQKETGTDQESLWK